jgi:D-3-phosphoglycerate dehydrogenase
MNPMPRKILITTSSFNITGNKVLFTLEKEGFEIIQNPFGRRLTESEAGDLLKQDVIGMIAGVEPLTRSVLMKAEGLKVISRCGIGMDNVDMAAAAENNILVHNTPDAPGIAVAELTVALMLNLLRHVSEADRRIRAERWKQLMGRLLQKQIVGMVGFGRIGKRVARLVSAFGATILAYDAYEMPPFPDVEFCSLDALLAKSDIISLHIPYTPEMHHFFNEEKMNAMKKGALLINASRGGLVDEAALAAALESGRLAGAALDCFETEPYSGPLAKMEQVVMTAHMGSYAQEARELMELEASDNLLQGLIAQGCLSRKE